MKDIPQWFLNLLEGELPSVVDSLWNEYQGWREDGYSKHFALVRVGLADADY